LACRHRELVQRFVEGEVVAADADHDDLVPSGVWECGQPGGGFLGDVQKAVCGVLGIAVVGDEAVVLAGSVVSEVGDAVKQCA